MMRPQDEDTIVAVATPPGYGGISVIRISGDQALQIAQKFCSRLPNQPESHKVYYSYFEYQDQLIDEVMVTYFEHGRSFTAEQTVEISCHGSPVICKTILDTLCANGARGADPGEFTYRAFMHGRIDLVQAEGVLQVIESRSSKVSSQAIHLLKGDLSSQIGQIQSDIVWILANLEAGIDFVEEGLVISQIEGLTSQSIHVQKSVEKLVDNYVESRCIFEGLNVGIFGCPNAGKSSLLNSLLKSDHAIVTDQPGTTRDLVKGQLVIKGVVTEFIDTAGLRESNDQVESIGINKSVEVSKQVDIVIFLISPDLDFDDQLNWLEKINVDVDMILVSKADLPSAEGTFGRIQQLPQLSGCKSLLISSQQESSREKFLVELVELAELAKLSHLTSQTALLSRHHDLLQKSLASLKAGHQMLEKDESPEFVAQEYQESLRYIKEIRGERVEEDVLDRVFREFCIGK